MKLFTALYDDSRILKHFLDHYGAAGVSDFYIAVSPGLASAVAAFMPDFNIEVFEGLNVADSFCCGVSAVTEMRKQRQGKCEWAVIVDLDEFIEFPDEIPALLSRAEREGTNVIRGIMYDRFSIDGRLVAFSDSCDLHQLYPVRSRFTSHVMQGCDHKAVIVKGLLDSSIAHHEFRDEQIFSTMLEVSHFKWNDRALDRVRQAHEIISKAGFYCAVEYQRVLEHYEQYGRFAWETFGGELVAGSKPTHRVSKPITPRRQRIAGTDRVGT